MPPHCDTLDGPVVRAARQALSTGDVAHVLPWVAEEHEAEVKEAFSRATTVGKLGAEALSLAETWFFETVVRLHRQGEGEPYTGLKPAGLDPGPVVPRAERAVLEGDPAEVIAFLAGVAGEELQRRFDRVMALRDYALRDISAARAYTRAMLDFVLFSHHLYLYMAGGEEHGE